MSAPDHTAEIIKVIRVEFVRGRGTQENPLRKVVAYHTLGGELLLEQDPHEAMTR